MEKPFQNIFKSFVEEHRKHVKKFRDPNEIIRGANWESKPSSDKTPVFHESGLAVLGRNGFSKALLRKIDENEDEAEETPLSVDEDKADCGMKKRVGKSCRETSSDKTPFLEALEEMMEDVEKSCRERRGPIPDKPSSSSQNQGLKMADGKFSVLGMGGIGETTIHNNGATIDFTFGTITTTRRWTKMTIELTNEPVLFMNL